MGATSRAVNRAYLSAVSDSDEKVAQLACYEMGYRGWPEGDETIFNALTNRSWNFRLAVCTAVLRQSAADQRVIAALEALNSEPESKDYNQKMTKFRQQELETFENTKLDPLTTTIDDLLEKARAMARANQKIQNK